MSRRLERVILAAIVLGAAALRVVGIDHHLLNDPKNFDEANNFVRPILDMIRSGSPNPTVYSGYPGFFNWLAFAPVAVGLRAGGIYGAYVGARMLVAAFGVLNVLLAYRLCRRWAGAPAALLAAALTAVARSHVSAAHNITPDVLVASGVLAVLAVLSSRADRPRSWMAAGALAGLTTAVKYTGLLTVPAVVVGLALAPQRRRSLPVALAAGLLAFALAAPYALVATGSMGMGFEHSIAHYYGADADANRALLGGGLAVGRVVGYFARDLGKTGFVLLVAALVLFRPRKALLPGLAVVAALFAITAPANKVYPRHVLPATAVALVVAGCGFEVLLARIRSGAARVAAGGAVAALALVPPALSTTRMALAFRGPTSGDQAVAWVESRVRTGALIASAFEPFAPDPTRFEVRGMERLEDLAVPARAHYDLVVVKGLAPRYLPDLEIAEEFCAGPKPWGCDMTFLRPRHALKLWRAPAPASVLGSTEGRSPAAAWDGDPTTVWTAPAGRSWLQARWDTPQPIVRVDLDVDGGEGSWPQTLAWEATDARGSVVRLVAFGLRPSRLRRQRTNAPHGDAFVFASPPTMRELRLVREDGGAWGVADLRALVSVEP